MVLRMQAVAPLPHSFAAGKGGAEECGQS